MTRSAAGSRRHDAAPRAHVADQHLLLDVVFEQQAERPVFVIGAARVFDAAAGALGQRIDHLGGALGHLHPEQSGRLDQRLAVARIGFELRRRVEIARDFGNRAPQRTLERLRQPRQGLLESATRGTSRAGSVMVGVPVSRFAC
jgi:hypothetical protein